MTKVKPTKKYFKSSRKSNIARNRSLKQGRVLMSVILVGGEFQARAAVTKKYRSPNVGCRDVGTTMD